MGPHLALKNNVGCLPGVRLYLAEMTCPDVADLQELSRAPLLQFGRRVAALPADLCAPFHDEARQLETELVGIYRFVALCTRNEEALDRVAQLWGMMVQICDDVARELRKLVDRHPHCGAECYYDRTLDLRNKCQRLLEMHR